jgi:hypothetical protein
MVVPDEKDYNEWTFTAFGTPLIFKWFPRAEQDNHTTPPGKYVANRENQSSNVRDIYYRRQLIWTRQRHSQPWTELRPQREEPLW